MTQRFLVTHDIDCLAGQEAHAGVGARQFMLLDAGAAVDLTFYDRNDEAVGTVTGAMQGFSVITEGYARVEITSAVNQTVRVCHANEQVSFNRLSGSIEANLSPSTGVTPGAATVGVAATTLPALVGQKRVTLKCASTNGGTVTIGTVSGTGITLGAGEGISLDTAASVPLIASAAGQVVEFLQEV